MKPGNTLDPNKLPPTEGMLHALPLKLGPDAGWWANVHFAVGLAGGFIGSVAVEMMRPPTCVLWNDVGRFAVPLVLFHFTLLFVVHYLKVCASYLRHGEQDKEAGWLFLYSLFIFFTLPLFLPVALWRSLKYGLELRRAWVSYLNYDSFGVGNPGVLQNPGRSVFTRVATFHLTIWVVSAWVLNLPAPYLTEIQLRQIGWWLCPPLLLGPPLLVMLVVSLVLSVNLGKLKKMRSG